MARSFTLNTGAELPSVGLGRWQAEPGIVGDTIITAIKVGMALKRLFNEGVVKREDVFITSKLCMKIHFPFRIKKGSSMEPENFVQPDIPATWGDMEALYDSRKARAIGVSNFSTRKLGDLLAIAWLPPAVNQVECHPGWQQSNLQTFC